MKTKEEYVLFLLRNYRAINDDKRTCESSFVPINGMIRDLQRVDCALDALDKYSKRIIKDIYFEGMSWLDAAEKNFVSHSTISRARKKALTTIIDYFEDNRSM